MVFCLSPHPVITLEELKKTEIMQKYKPDHLVDNIDPNKKTNLKEYVLDSILYRYNIPRIIIEKTFECQKFNSLRAYYALELRRI